MSAPQIRKVSEEKPIRNIEFGDNPFDRQKEKRKCAHEEAARDLEKESEQILVDIHDESLDAARPAQETIARAIARLASLQLRQAKETERLNQKITLIGFVIGGFGLAIGMAQVVLALISLCRGH